MPQPYACALPHAHLPRFVASSRYRRGRRVRKHQDERARSGVDGRTPSRLVLAPRRYTRDVLGRGAPYR
jgi:hypothetical protein